MELETLSLSGFVAKQLPIFFIIYAYMKNPLKRFVFPHGLPFEAFEAFEAFVAPCGPQLKLFEDYEKAQEVAPHTPHADDEECADSEHDPSDIAGNFMFEIAAGIVCFNESLAIQKN